MHCLKPVKAYFGFDRLLAITASRIEAYQDYRLKEGRARATVNREVRYLLHAFRLLFKAHEISYLPEVKLLEGENVREGFTNRPEFEELVSNSWDAGASSIYIGMSSDLSSAEAAV